MAWAAASLGASWWLLPWWGQHRARVLELEPEVGWGFSWGTLVAADLERFWS